MRANAQARLPASSSRLASTSPASSPAPPGIDEPPKSAHPESSAAAAIDRTNRGEVTMAIRRG